PCQLSSAIGAGGPRDQPGQIKRGILTGHRAETKGETRFSCIRRMGSGGCGAAGGMARNSRPTPDSGDLGARRRSRTRNVGGLGPAWRGRLILFEDGLIYWGRRRPPVTDQAAAALAIRLAHEYVGIFSGSLLEYVAGVQQPGARIDRLRRVELPRGALLFHMRGRVQLLVSVETNTIANVARTEERQHQIRPFSHAPKPERLTQVFIVRLKADMRCNIEEAKDAERGIGNKTPKIRRRINELTLQGAVHHYGRFAQIAEKVRDAFADRRRDHGAITLGDRLHHITVELVVEHVDGAIDRLKRIVRPPGLL